MKLGDLVRTPEGLGRIVYNYNEGEYEVELDKEQFGKVVCRVFKAKDVKLIEPRKERVNKYPSGVAIV